MLVTALPTALAAGGIFSDVPSGAWYEDAVTYVHDRGIMNGTSATTFSPERSMTRAMLTVVLYRAAGSPAVSGQAAFSDLVPGAYYESAVAWASANGIVTGYRDGRFRPDTPVSRAQIAAPHLPESTAFPKAAALQAGRTRSDRTNLQTVYLSAHRTGCTSSRSCRRWKRAMTCCAKSR